MNDFTHFRKFLAKRYGLYFPCVFEFAICRSWRLWRGLYSRLIYSIVSHKRTTMATWRHRWGALYVVDCLLVIMAKPDTWKPLFVEKAPWELNQWKLTWGYMWCLSKTKCKFMSGFYWLHFRKTNSTNPLNQDIWYFDAIFSHNEEEECMITIWYWERIVIFASGFVNLFYLERSLKLCQRHLATKGVAMVLVPVSCSF